MKNIVVLAALLAALSTSAQTEIPDMTLCAAGEIGCEVTVFGALDASDCLLESGARADAYRFQGRVNQLVTVTVRSLSPGYAVPAITLVPPSGEGMRTSTTIGGAGASIRYRVAEAGEWHVVVGTTDPASTGAYVLDMQCSLRDASLGSDCVDQQILCGQTHTANLTQRSCRFSNARERAAQSHELYGVAGDVFSIELDSADFEPKINIYEPGTFGPIVRSEPGQGGKARLTFAVPKTGMYWITAYPTEDRKFGRYTLRVNCAMSGCLTPVIMAEPEVVEVSYGESATLDVDVHHVGGPVEYLWFRFRDFPELVGTTSVPQFKTGPITGDGFYYVLARNQCGDDTSKMMTVSVKSRRRAARH